MKSLFKKRAAKMAVAGLVALGAIGVSLVGHSYDFINSQIIQQNSNILVSPYSLILPHDLLPNTTAKAGDVQDNFNYLLKAFNDNFRFETSSKTVDIIGHIKTLPPTGGKAPTLEAGCGQATIKGTDAAGIVTFGADAGNMIVCYIKFAISFAGPPVCTVSSDDYDRKVPIASKVYNNTNGSTLTITSSEPFHPNESVSYICLGL